MLSLSDALLDKVSTLVGVQREALDRTLPLSAYGLDSMACVRLQEWLAEYGVDSMLAVRLQNRTFEQIQAEVAFGE